MIRCSLTALVILLAAAVAVPQEAASAEPDRWAPVHRLVGEWHGTGTGLSGKITTKHSYEFLFNGRFLHSRTFSQSEPAEEDSLGEIHEGWGFFSYDPKLASIVFRQFLSEGYVNTYVLESPKAAAAFSEKLVFTTTATEGAGGMQARLTIEFISKNEYRMVLELAQPGKDWFNCQNLVMHRGG